MKVKLEDIIEAMEFANMETEYYYDCFLLGTL
jgi:hypothetical protein